MEYNGGSVVAMIGKDCVAIASDLRLGQQAVGVAANFDKVCIETSRILRLSSERVLTFNRCSLSTIDCFTVCLA